MFYVADRNKKYTKYFPVGGKIELILLHDQKKTSLLQYPDKILLSEALETFKCCLNLI